MSMARSASRDKSGFLVMNGREVFRHAVTLLASAVNEALAANNLTSQDIDWLVPHQANRRIIDGVGRKLGLPAGARGRHRGPARQHLRRQHPAGSGGGDDAMAGSNPASLCCWRRSAAA